MTTTPSKGARLRSMITSGRLEFLMEAHSGVSARIAEEAGFEGLWASGLALSAQCGVRDNNELSWTQLVDQLEFMSDASSIPILVDGDTGHGNFNNLRRLVRKLEQRGIAGICIEDKLFPKTNSFIDSERQPLADVEEFCGKIKAGKDTQGDPDFCLVARVEALIAGWGIDHALERAEAYREAGADAILIHSKRKGPDEVLAFAEEWDGRLPLVIVPTTYYSTPTEVFERAGISVVIWANHLVRSSIAAMQNTAREICESRSVAGIEDRIVPVSEVFRLQGAKELAEAERRYAGTAQRERVAVVLAAGRGEALGALTEDRPKIMVPVAGRPLLSRLVDDLKRQAVNEITVVTGYRSDAVDSAGVRLVENREYGTTGELASLAKAEDFLEQDSLVLYGDLLFRNYLLEGLFELQDELSVVVDSLPPESVEGGSRDYAFCSAPDDRSLFGAKVRLQRVESDPEREGQVACGRWIGMLRVAGEGRAWVSQALAELRARGDFDSLDMPDLLNHLIESGRPIRVMYVHGHWLDVNSLDDLDRAGRFAGSQGGARAEIVPGGSAARRGKQRVGGVPAGGTVDRAVVRAKK